MQEEIWKPIDGTQGIYWISDKGRAKRLTKTTIRKDGRTMTFSEIILKPIISERSVTVSVNGKIKSIAKLVATAFVPNPRGLKQLYHIDGDMLNNEASNLAWGHPSVELYNGKGLTEKEWLMLNYEVTTDGRVIRKVDGKELLPSSDHKGYLRIRLKSAFAINKDGRKAYKVHRLVAMYYLNDYSDNLQVNHINGNKQDNRIENLEMVTNAQNVWHAWHVLDTTERRRKLSEQNKKRANKKQLL